jgi:hypothetical protein
VGVGPEGMLALDTRLFVCLTRYLSPGEFGPGAVMVYDRVTLTLLDSLQVGINPQSIAVDAANRLHVVCTNSYGDAAGSIHIFDATTLVRDTILATGGSPAEVSFGGGYAFVAAGGWGEQGEVYRYRLSDLAMVNDAVNPIYTGSGATDIEVPPDGSFYVSCSLADQVEHRTAEGTLLEIFPMSLGPGQMVLTPPPSAARPPRVILPQDARIAEAYPNPFNSAVRLVLSGSRRTFSYINIYNVLGMKVGTVGVPAGVDKIVWNPALNHGISVPSGTYWAVWEGGGGENGVKLLYLK